MRLGDDEDCASEYRRVGLDLGRGCTEVVGEQGEDGRRGKE